MTPKSAKKSSTPWYCCEKCDSYLTQKDITVHENSCPPSTDKWSHNYIRNDILYSSIELYNPRDPPKNISQRELNELVFMAQSAMQLCKIPIGDPVVLSREETKVVKVAWPTNDKTLTSVSLTKHAIDLNKLDGQFSIEKLKSEVYLATEVSIEYVGTQKLPEATTELDVLVKNYNEKRIFTIGNRISIPYYGKKLIFRIRDIKAENVPIKSMDGDTIPRSLDSDFEALNISDGFSREVKFYKALYSTKWTILSIDDSKAKVEDGAVVKTCDIAGYDNLIAEIRDVIDIALGKYRILKGFYITRGILLYGTLGVGKSMIAKALMAESAAYLLTVTGSDIYSKYVGETEAKLREIFAEAKRNAPSIIFMDDIHSLCVKKNSTTTDQEKRILSTLLSLFDDLQNSNVNVLVITTTSQPHALDPTLRRPGRIDKEFEVSVPTQSVRKEILLKLLSKMSHELSSLNIAEIAFVTHGFVAADIFSLCSRAAMHAVRRRNSDDVLDADIVLTSDDFNYALTIVSPSAMKEVLVEVPNVKWSDIGGQKDLKLKLKQAVEWPLMHPEAFVRLGITPPRGVLMFGPPGCSKTMIAKALATESQLNFLNIKGPELFSKWVGESERAVREVFRKARQVAPSIIFIDEIDALGGERGSSSSSSGGSNVQERVLAQLLTELDGVTELGNVTLVAATNRPDRIDKALLRPGRLDRIVYVPLPDFETRREIFDIKLRKMPVSADVDVDDLVDLTEGYSGAEVQAICHEAAMKALEENLDAIEITKEHFKAALSIVTPRTPASLIKLYEDYLSRN